MQPQSTSIGSTYDDLPIDRCDNDALDREGAYIPTFESACYHGPLSTVQSIVSSDTPPPPRTRFFLHHGLIVALHTGNIDIARYLLSVGAPIVRHTPTIILSAPSDQQIPLFELLLQHGWTVNSPGFYGAVLLPHVVANLPLLHWFLLHGADPNIGEQRNPQNRTGGSDTDSCAALEAAAGQSNVAAVRLLLDAGAQIQHGVPLHFAAGACPPGMSPYDRRVTSSKEFDTSRIPVMALLVERGAECQSGGQVTAYVRTVCNSACGHGGSGREGKVVARAWSRSGVDRTVWKCSNIRNKNEKRGNEICY